MKVKEGYIMRPVAGIHVVIAVGDAAREFSGMIRLNETGALLFPLLQEEATLEELRDALVKDYEIDAETAQADAADFVKTLRDAHVLEDA